MIDIDKVGNPKASSELLAVAHAIMNLSWVEMEILVGVIDHGDWDVNPAQALFSGCLDITKTAAK